MQRLEIFADNRVQKLKAGRLSHNLAELLKIQYTAKPKGDDVKLGNSSAIQIGDLDVILLPSAKEKSIDQELIISSDSKELLRIPVHAQIVSAFGLYPQTVSLPRYSTGQALYAAKVLCRNSYGTILTVRVRKKSPHLGVCPSNHPPLPQDGQNAAGQRQ